MVVSDTQIQQAMKWTFEKHGLRSEPSGAITIAAALCDKIDLSGEGDIVIVLSGCNVDTDAFERHVR